MDDILVVNTKEQLDKYLKKYNCQTKEELDDILWYTYGVDLQINIKRYKI